jgi:hypothetical protein
LCDENASVSKNITPYNDPNAVSIEVVRGPRALGSISWKKIQKLTNVRGAIPKAKSKSMAFAWLYTINTKTTCWLIG